MAEIKIKGVVAAFATIISYTLNCFNELVAVLIALMVIDYATGITAAYCEGNIQSRKGYRGIVKKVGFMILITLAFFLDFVISSSLVEINIALPFKGTFGFTTTIWLIGNEGVSIIENLGTIGVPLPPFLKEAFKKLKNKDD